MRLKYTAPRSNVRIVISQVDALIDGAASDSPFMSPATRDKDPAFGSAYGAMYKEQLCRRSSDIATSWRRNTSRPRARILRSRPIRTASRAMPRRCAPSVRIPVAPRSVHEIGLQQIDILMSEMSAIGERTFHTKNIPALMQALRTDKQYLFKNRADLIAYSEAALARAKTAVPNWFGLLPKADVVVQPYPRYREKNASNEYNAPAEDGAGRSSTSTRTRQRQSRGRRRNPPRFTKRFPGITCRSRSRWNGRTFTR